MVEFDGFSALGFPLDAKTQSDVDKARAACEIIITLTVALHRAIDVRLAYDNRKRADGFKGRFLMYDVPVSRGEELRRGDRLEPSPELLDIGSAFDDLNLFPIRVVCWRSSKSHIVQHKNPFWNEAIGCTPDRHLGVDPLHTMALGVVAFFLRVRDKPLSPIGCFGHSRDDGNITHQRICRPHAVRTKDLFTQRRKLEI